MVRLLYPTFTYKYFSQTEEKEKIRAGGLRRGSRHMDKSCSRVVKPDVPVTSFLSVVFMTVGGAAVS